ncbi:hypothetical protein KI387_023279 [Taxus chinensis]|uniref:Ubiquitin carboxyl-terminal hydrolase n=1 Tax=Taxus chinensis TaxID=29808 RepID=A0AA38G273_TAXCH|nr:hypothetical protein KI387_023279 [Taxus chinensis]
MNAMEGDALSLALDQSQEEEEPLCEVLPPSPDSPKASQVGLLTAYPWWKEQDEISSKDNEDDIDEDVRGAFRVLSTKDEDDYHVGAGLRNLGNTCFLNAVVQCLTYTQPLVNCLKYTPHTNPCEHEGFCAFCVLQEHVNTVAESCGQIIEPLQLVDNLSNLSSSFEKYQQEDAHEYMHCLLEALHKSTLSPKAAKACLLLQGDSFVKELFGGRLRSQIRCVECSHCSDSYEPLIDLSLEINNSDSITEALESFTVVETIQCDEKFQCEKCKLGKSVFKQLTIDRAPEVLSIQLKRFINTGTIGTKILKDVSYPQILDLKPFVNNDQDMQGDLKYELYGVLVHSGWTMNFGHYYSFVQTSPNVWHKLDDSQVKAVDIETVLQQQAYILFYFRQGVKWFPGPAEEASKCMSVESPKSVLDDSNANDDSDSLTDKEYNRSNDGQKGLEEESSRIMYDGQNAIEEDVCEANGHPSPPMDMPSKSLYVNPYGEKEAAIESLAPSSSLLAEKRFTVNSTHLSVKERALAESVPSFKKTEQDDQAPKHSRKMLVEESEDIPKSSKKTKIQGDEGMPKFSSRIKPQEDEELPKSSKKSSFDNVASLSIKCSQGTPNSIKKVLNNMPGSRRACLMQYVQANTNGFETPKKEIFPSHGRKKRNSPLSGSVEGKRQKQNGADRKSSPGDRSSRAAGSSKHASQGSQEKQENLVTLENDPYIFEGEIEQMHQYGCRANEVRSSSKVDMSSFYSPAESKKITSNKSNVQRSKRLKEEAVINTAKHRISVTEAGDGLCCSPKHGIKTFPSIAVSTV